MKLRTKMLKGGKCRKGYKKRKVKGRNTCILKPSYRVGSGAKASKKRSSLGSKKKRSSLGAKKKRSSMGAKRRKR